MNDVVSDELEFIAGKGGTNDSFVLNVNKVRASSRPPLLLSSSSRPPLVLLSSSRPLLLSPSPSPLLPLPLLPQFDAATLMKASKAENEAAIAAGIDLLMVQGDGGLHEKARVTQHADDCVK